MHWLIKYPSHSHFHLSLNFFFVLSLPTTRVEKLHSEYMHAMRALFTDCRDKSLLHKRIKQKPSTLVYTKISLGPHSIYIHNLGRSWNTQRVEIVWKEEITHSLRETSFKICLNDINFAIGTIAQKCLNRIQIVVFHSRYCSSENDNDRYNWMLHWNL